MQREWSKVVGVDVHIYIIWVRYIIVCLWTKNKFESNFSDKLTFSNIRGRTSSHRPALPLLSPETLSSSSRSRIFLYNAHLALFVRMDDTITRTNVLVSIVI